MRRWKQRYEHHGYDGLFDRRRRRPSPRRVPLETVRRVLQLYREHYRDFNVAHFCDQLRERHDIALSYQWVKSALQTAGVVAPRAQHGRHHQRRERRPLPGMMLYVDGSTHA
jgi:transposase